MVIHDHFQAKEVNYPLKKIYQVDASKRSVHSNAYMYGFGKNKRIVLYDTLLDTGDDRILAVVGHELGHWKLNHTIKNIVISFAHMFIIFYLFGFVLYSDHQIYESFGFYDKSRGFIIIGLILFSNVYGPVIDNEYQNDLSAESSSWYRIALPDSC